MIFYRADDFEFDNTDVLIVAKKHHKQSLEQLKADYPYIFGKWNNTTKSYMEWSTLQLDSYGLNGDKKFEYICSTPQKMVYAFKCMHEDSLVFNTIKSIIPYIENVEIPADRSCNKYYLQYWMQQYNFTLEDFIFDDAYTLISSCNYCEELYKLEDLGLLDWDRIDYCSE